MIVLIRKEQGPMTLHDATDQSQCLLLTLLPSEIRNQIWMEILVQQRTESHDLGRHRFCANILRTCKQINAEGTPILYGLNVFSAHSTLLATLPSFLLITLPKRVTLPPVVHPRVMRLIRKYFIFVRLDTDPRYSRRQVEESFSGIDELSIEVFQAMYGSCDFINLKLFEGVRGVGKVKIDGSLGDRKYANWLAECMQSPPGTEFDPYQETYVGGSRVWSAWQAGAR